MNNQGGNYLQQIEGILVRNGSKDLAEKLMSEMAQIQGVSKEVKEEMDLIDKQTSQLEELQKLHEQKHGNKNAPASE